MTAIGAYNGNDLNATLQFDQWLGRSTDHILAFTGRANWADWTGSIPWAIDLWSKMDKPVIWSVPMFPVQGTLAASAAGLYDKNYLDAAKALAATRPGDAVIHIRIGEEFNGDWMPWAAKGQEQNFVDAYRNFVDIFRSVSDRFVFEWNVNVGDMGMDPATAYPGDDYVDVIGMDFYYDTTWDSKDPQVAWDFMVNRTYGLQWLEDFAAAHGKPTAYTEWGVNSDGAEEYIKNVALWFDNHNVLYQNYWDSNAAFPGDLSSGQYPKTGTAFRDAFGVEKSPSAPAESGATQKWFFGTSASETLTGTDGNDWFQGSGGADRMIGGKGDDYYFVDGSDDVIVEKAGEGIDTVESYAKSYTLSDNVENLFMKAIYDQTGIGNALDNRIIGGATANIIEGKGGNDWLTGGGGVDTFVLKPGDGDDVITDFTAGAAGDKVQLVSFGYSSFAEIKGFLYQDGSRAVLSLPDGTSITFLNTRAADFVAGNFTFVGPAAPEQSSSKAALKWTPGTSVSETLYGSSGGDYINGAGGNDTLIGGTGDDTYIVDSPADVIVEYVGGGTDTVESYARNYSLSANVEHLIMLATYDQDGTGNALDNRITGSIYRNVIDGKAGDDWMTGGGGSDTFVIGRNSGKDVITDFSGDDVVLLDKLGFSSYQQVLPLMAQKGGDVVLTLPEGGSVTFLSKSLSDFTPGNFAFGGPAAPALGGTPQKWISGTGASETLTGSSGNDWMQGQGGTNVMIGLGGDDYYLVVRASDTVVEAAKGGIDTIESYVRDNVLADNVENLLLKATYAQTGVGNDLDNRIVGSGSDNIIEGKGGIDWLTGGGGSDLFVFGPGSGKDVITDFDGDDFVKLEGSRFESTGAVLSALVQKGSDVVLQLSSTDSVTFFDTTIKDFQNNDFLLN